VRPGAGGSPRAATALAVGLLGGGATSTVIGHVLPSPALFWLGVVALVIGTGPVSFAAGLGRWPTWVLGLQSTFFSLLLFGLLAEGLWRVLRDPDPSTIAPIASYEAARRNPALFRSWWNRHVEAFLELPILAPGSVSAPFVLRPGSRAVYHDSEIRINRLGFRGDEISREKGGLYRIFALGESTTFGITMSAGDRPWPEVLEAAIRERFECDAPVQVVNAGVPGWTLANQIARLEREIIPLKPDLIVSYHGYNGFHFFFRELPGMVVQTGDLFVERPSRLWSRLENGLRLWSIRRRYAAIEPLDESVASSLLLETAYAKQYRELVARAGAHDVPVALSTFNMAIDGSSPEEAIRFYEAIFPDARVRERANELHNRLVRELGPLLGVRVVEATPELNGRYRDFYTDIVHFNQAGRERLAQNMLRGLEPFLLAAPRPHCRERAGRSDRLQEPGPGPSGPVGPASSGSQSRSWNPPMRRTVLVRDRMYDQTWG